MVELAEERLAGYNKLNSTKRRAVFYAMQRISRYDRARGARLPQWAFSSEKIGRYIQEGFVECGLAKCPDWNSWKPTGSDFRNAKARAFIPCTDLVWADTGSKVVSTFPDYCNGRHGRRAPLHTESRLVWLHQSSRVSVRDIVVTALRHGIGIYCDFSAIPDLLLRLSEEERSRKLCAAFASVGRVQVEELRPIWKQHEWGRVYCSKPALVNMPKVLLSALRSVDGFPLWNVDFSSYELRIACNIFEQQLPDGDAYNSLADGCGITRERVKTVFNPMLHGQTKHQLWYADERDTQAIADRPLVEKEMARSLPQLFRGLEQLRHDHSVLQRTGAAVFFSCMAAAMDRCGIINAGLPKHDGWIFAGDESQARAVAKVFENEAQRITGVSLPVKLEAIQ